MELRLVDPSTKFTVQPPEPSVRLVQVDDLSSLLDNLDPQEGDASTDAVDNLLDEARGLLKEDPAPARLFPNAEDSGREPSEAMRNLLKQELDKLLPAERAEDDAATKEDGSEPLPSGIEEVAIDDLVDPVPAPIYRRSTPRPNQPYTLAGILADEDRIDPNLEAEYCQRVWECAGGKCQRPIGRFCREWRRDRDVIRRGDCGPRWLNPLMMLPLPMLGCRTCESACTTSDGDGEVIVMSQATPWGDGEPTVLRAMQHADRAEQIWMPKPAQPTPAR